MPNVITWDGWFFVDLTDVSSIDSGRPDTPDTDESSEVGCVAVLIKPQKTEASLL